MVSVPEQAGSGIFFSDIFFFRVLTFLIFKRLYLLNYYSYKAENLIHARYHDAIIEYIFFGFFRFIVSEKLAKNFAFFGKIRFF